MYICINKPMPTQVYLGILGCSVYCSEQLAVKRVAWTINKTMRPSSDPGLIGGTRTIYAVGE